MPLSLEAVISTEGVTVQSPPLRDQDREVVERLPEGRNLFSLQKSPEHRISRFARNDNKQHQTLLVGLTYQPVQFLGSTSLSQCLEARIFKYLNP